ncbi:unnamed protein product [Camellia sinensis]
MASLQIQKNRFKYRSNLRLRHFHALILLQSKMKYVKAFNLFHDLMKTKPLERGRLLGLDVGDKYVGLAVSDTNNKIASPLRVEYMYISLVDMLVDAPTCQSSNMHYKFGSKYSSLRLLDVVYLGRSSVLIRKKSKIDLMASDFQSLICELSLTGFVFGYPFDRLRSSPDVKLLIDDLCKTGKLEGLKYTFWNECFTSKQCGIIVETFKFTTGAIQKVFLGIINDCGAYDLSAECGIIVETFKFTTGAIQDNNRQICCCRNTPGIPRLCEQESKVEISRVRPLQNE